ncbi:hypothetical protein KFK09_007104 [Dendrobium nobile]|uniref:Reverse transcriptase domain-containing protein n=1 Tax=Dendrobium nobile TaxID=94219 RepID=A0A8T3BT66_DENNO|nr:hypothetical protein KFK09_007104 [Dendrobium nobile]
MMLTFLLLLMGTLEGFFPSSSGIRQGCPLSPYLFCIIMDAFSCLIYSSPTIESFEGFKYENFGITHLSYADDLLVFGKADALNAARLARILYIFSNSSGLHLNLNKSTIIIHNNFPRSADISHSLNIPNPPAPSLTLACPSPWGESRLLISAPLWTRSLDCFWVGKLIYSHLLVECNSLSTLLPTRLLIGSVGAIFLKASRKLLISSVLSFCILVGLIKDTYTLSLGLIFANQFQKVAWELPPFLLSFFLTTARLFIDGIIIFLPLRTG